MDQQRLGGKYNPIILDEDPKPFSGATSEQPIKKKVKWAQDLPKYEKEHPFCIIKDEKFLLEPMRSSKRLNNLHNNLYDDAEERGIRELEGVSRKRSLKVIETMKTTREYAQEVDFGCYCVRTPSDTLIMGRVSFTNFVYDLSQEEGFIEAQFHLTSDYTGNGIGYEILKRLLPELIEPKLGKTCLFMKSSLKLGVGLLPQEAETPEGCFRSVFQGIYRDVPVMRDSGLNHMAQINSYYKAGFGVKLWNGNVTLSYPPERYPPGKPLEQSEIVHILRISKLMEQCRSHKRNKLFGWKKDADLLPGESCIDLAEILSSSPVYDKLIPKFKDLYIKLLAAEEPYTVLSALDILIDGFGMAHDELSIHFQPDRVAYISENIEKFWVSTPSLDRLKILFGSKE